jgi:hypothetical protein
MESIMAKVKLSFQKAVETHRAMIRRGSHIV